MKPPTLSAAAMMDAAARCNLNRIQQLLAAGARPEHLMTKSANAVTEACFGWWGGWEKQEKTRLAVVRELVSAGCRVEGQALYRPIDRGELALLRFLIEHGADVNVTAPKEYYTGVPKGCTPLGVAVQYGRLILIAICGICGPLPNFVIRNSEPSIFDTLYVYKYTIMWLCVSLHPGVLAVHRTVCGRPKSRVFLEKYVLHLKSVLSGASHLPKTPGFPDPNTLKTPLPLKKNLAVPPPVQKRSRRPSPAIRAHQRIGLRRVRIRLVGTKSPRVAKAAVRAAMLPGIDHQLVFLEMVV